MNSTFLKVSAGILMLSLSVLLVKVASTNWSKTAAVDDKQLEVFLKGYESGKKIGYAEGIDATLNVLKANPELFKSESSSEPNKAEDKKTDDLINKFPSITPNTNKS